MSCSDCFHTGDAANQLPAHLLFNALYSVLIYNAIINTCYKGSRNYGDLLMLGGEAKKNTLAYCAVLELSICQGRHSGKRARC